MNEGTNGGAEQGSEVLRLSAQQGALVIVL